MSRVKIRIDEAGDFNYDNSSRFWVSVVAGVAIPDKRWEAVQNYIVDRSSVWGMSELKAADMHRDQLLDVARFILAEELTVVAIATDSRIFTALDQRRWRACQVETFSKAADRSKRANDDVEIADRVARLRRRMHRERHIKQANYLQYGILMPWLIGRLISSALYAYRGLSPKDDSWLFDIVMDAKGGADPGKPGELLRDSIEHILVSDDRTALWVPPEWADDHPFKVRNTDREKPVISARQVLAEGIKPGESHEDPGLQLADFVAHLLLTIIRDPDSDDALTIWSALAPRVMPTDEGWPIKVWAWPAHELPDEDVRRYERLAKPG